MALQFAFKHLSPPPFSSPNSNRPVRLTEPYFAVNKQCFRLITNQRKYQYKPNFSQPFTLLGQARGILMSVQAPEGRIA